MVEGINPSAYNLSAPYEAQAIYYEMADSVEYVRKDEPSVYDRVDELLTLIYSMRNRSELIGFQLKGFKNFYLQDSVRAQLGDDFLSLVGLLERVMTATGEHVFEKRTRDAYERAHRIALEDRVALHDLPKLAQA
jgi:hypothetical protein